ncbi:MAG: GlsB/YeaQ/YmgE family stress response membrane protein [Burkholderiaceae bacterium]
MIWTLIIGLVAGALAKLIMPGDQGGGIIMTMILGVVGSVVASYGGQALGLYPPGVGAGLIGSVVGALIVLVIYGMLTKKKA